MSTEDIQTKLNSLNQVHGSRLIEDRYLELLYWYCRIGSENRLELDERRRIAGALRVSKTSIFNHRKRVADKMGIDNIREVPDEICLVLNEQLATLPTIPIELYDTEEEIVIEVISGPDFSELVWPPSTVEPDPTALDNYVAAIAALNASVEGFEAEMVDENDLLTSLRFAMNAYDDLDDTNKEGMEESFSRLKGRVFQLLQGTPPPPPVEETPQQSQITEDFLAGAAATQQEQSSHGDSGAGDNGDGDNGGEHGGNPRLTAVIIIGAVIIALLALGIGWLYRRAQETIPPFENIAGELSEAVANPEEFMPIPEDTATPVIVTKIVVATTVPAPPTAVPTIEEVIVTPTDLPTDTPTPTDTSTPTLTPTPVPVVRFEDDFDAGPNEAWATRTGEALYSNGQLRSGEGTTWLEIGDPNWEDYTVGLDFNIYHFQEAFVGVRASDEDDMVVLRLKDEGTGTPGIQMWWTVVEDGNWKRQDGTTRGAPTVGSVTIEVNGNSFAARIENGEDTQFFHLGHQKGNIWLGIGGGVTVDNFKISPIEE